MTDDEPTTKRCRAAIVGGRCDFQGTREQLRDHAADVGHPRCVICTDALGIGERQTCQRCEANVRDDLDGLARAYAHLERVILQAAHRGVAWDALTLAADGSLASPQRPDQYTRPVNVAATVHVEHSAIVGEEFTHAAFIEERLSSDGREHVADHWETDPMSVLAVLEHNERDWRHEFGHGPAVDMATVAGCLTYLRKWHWLAAGTHPGFDDYAETIRELRSRLEHVVGLANVPAKGAPCACGKDLRRAYGQDDWTCPGCGTVITRGEYLWRLRLASHVPGFVSVAEAAQDVGRSMRTVQTWARLGEVPVVCIRITRRVVVELASVRARAEEVGQRERQAS